MPKFRCFLLFFLALVVIHPSGAQNLPNPNLWQRLDHFPSDRAGSNIWIRPTVFGAFQLNHSALREILRRAPKESEQSATFSQTVISLPMPDGTVARFRFVESPVMAPELAAKFPEIKTYLGQGSDDPLATVRFDRTPA